MIRSCPLANEFSKVNFCVFNLCLTFQSVKLIYRIQRFSHWMLLLLLNMARLLLKNKNNNNNNILSQHYSHPDDFTSLSFDMTLASNHVPFINSSKVSCISDAILTESRVFLTCSTLRVTVIKTLLWSIRSLLYCDVVTSGFIQEGGTGISPWE